MTGIRTEEIASLDFLGGIFLDIEQEWNERADYTGVFDAYMPFLEEQHQKRFDARRSSEGETWEPWHWRPPWVADSHPTLEVSGALRGSLKQGGAGHIHDVDHTGGGQWFATFGTDVDYASIHMFGATFTLGIPMVGRGGTGYLPIGTTITIPARPFVGVSETDIEKLAVDASDSIVEQLKHK